MKQSILIISMVVLSYLNVNATNLKSATNPVNETEITNPSISRVYEWSVKTISGKSSGKSSSLKNAKEMIALFSTNDIVLEKKIVSYYFLTSELNKLNNRTYYWEVKSTNGNAKGFSSSESNARDIIALVSKGEVISYKIIISTQNK